VNVVEPSALSFADIVSSTVNSVVETTVFTVNVLLLFPVPVIVTRSLTANLPDPVSTVEVEDIDPLVDMLMSVPVMFATCDFSPISVVLVCAITLFIQYFSF
jgi:hypothetical protein